MATGLDGGLRPRIEHKDQCKNTRSHTGIINHRGKYSMKAGDRIRLTYYTMGYENGTVDHTVEEFRFCLGIFESDEHREAGQFTPLCELYDNGPESEDKYISNFGSYRTNQVPAFMNIPRVKS